MGRKSHEQLIQDRLNEALTIGQLIEHLKGLPQDAYFGVVGHFGEANLMNKHDFSYIRRSYITATEFWRGKRHHIDILDMHVPDIGPNPD